MEKVARSIAETSSRRILGAAFAVSVLSVCGGGSSSKTAPQDAAATVSGAAIIAAYSINAANNAAPYYGYNFPSPTAGVNGFIDPGFLNGQFVATGDTAPPIARGSDGSFEFTWTPVVHTNGSNTQPAYYRIYVQLSPTGEGGPYAAWENGPSENGISYLNSSYGFDVPLSGWANVWFQAYIAACDSNNNCNSPPATTANLGIAYYSAN